MPPKAAPSFLFFFLTEKNSEALECYFALQEIQAMGFLHVGLGKSEMFLNIVPYLFRKKKVMRWETHTNGAYVPMKFLMYQCPIPETPLTAFTQVSFFIFHSTTSAPKMFEKVVGCLV